MRRIYTALIALVCSFALTGPALPDVWTQPEMERCFAYQDEEITAQVVLQFNGDLVAGVAFGNVFGGTGNIWSYASVLDGVSRGGTLNLMRDMRIDGHRQSDKVLWQTGPSILDTGEREYQATDCISVHAAFVARGLAASLGVHRSEVAIGKPFSFALSSNTKLTGFKPHELAFATPTDGIARAQFASMDFYAIILVSAPRCELTEADHQAAQQRFEDHKVFMDRFNCNDDIEEAMTYANVSPDVGFIAVHAGGTYGDAEKLFAEVEQWGSYPGANIRQMHAVLNYP